MLTIMTILTPSFVQCCGKFPNSSKPYERAKNCLKRNKTFFIVYAVCVFGRVGAELFNLRNKIKCFDRSFYMWQSINSLYGFLIYNENTNVIYKILPTHVCQKIPYHSQNHR